MVSKWKELRLDEVTELIVDCPHSTPKWTDEGIVVLRSNNIKNGRLDVSSPSYTDQDGYEKRVKRAVPQAGDLVLTREAPMGEVCQIPEGLKCCLGQRMVLIRVKEEVVDSKYLLYTLQSPYLQYQISWNEGTGTTVSNIRIPNIKAFQIPTPPIAEQKAIAHILGRLDDKIELNRQTNETLEAMAQALFKSWFVDFDPVIDNALLAGNSIPEPLKERAEMRQAQLDSGKAKTNSEINSLFPSEFEFTEELGWIPKGWEVSNINNEFEVTMGQSPPGSSYNEEQEGIAFFQGSTDFGFRYPTNRIYTTEAKRLADKDDTLVSVRAPVGTVNMATQKCCIGRGLSAVRHKSGNSSYTYYSMIQLHQRFQVFESQGTVFGSINQKDFKALLQIKAPDNLLNKFEEYAGSLDNKIETNSLQIITLANLRDTLLPKLMSGELRIADTEKLAENI